MISSRTGRASLVAEQHGRWLTLTVHVVIKASVFQADTQFALHSCGPSTQLHAHCQQHMLCLYFQRAMWMVGGSLQSGLFVRWGVICSGWRRVHVRIFHTSRLVFSCSFPPELIVAAWSRLTIFILLWRSSYINTKSSWFCLFFAASWAAAQLWTNSFMVALPSGSCWGPSSVVIGWCVAWTRAFQKYVSLFH